MSFSELNLDPSIVKRLTRAGIVEPTPIQSQAVATLLERRDVIALAPTGSGKTIAFLAPIAHRLLAEQATPERRRARSAGGEPAALIITPTRELAEQIGREAVRIAGGIGLRIVVAYGGVGMKPQADSLAAGADILIATPGRIRDLLEADRLDLSSIRILIIDEADRMMDMGFLPQVESIVRSIPRDRLTGLFTATMPDDVVRLADRFLDRPVRIEIGEHTRTAAHVHQRLFPVMEHLKVKLLLRLLEDESRQGVLIFARTRRRVGWVASALERHGISVAALHGDRTQAQRRRALEKFRKGELRTIVATDVAARGLHIESVRTVINYDLPIQPEEYVHRVGRAGHGGVIPTIEAEGEGITLLDPRDTDHWQRIARAVDVCLKPEHLVDFDYQEPKRGGRSKARSMTDRKHPGRDSRTKDTAPRDTVRESTRPKRPRRLRKGDKPHEPPRIGGKPKRRHSASKPLRGNQKPGRGAG